MSRLLPLAATLRNGTRWTLSREAGFAIGSQYFDPESGRFIEEGEWLELDHPVAPGGELRLAGSLLAPKEQGNYQLIASIVHPEHGWLYRQGLACVVMEVDIDASHQVTVRRQEVLTWGQLEQRRRGRRWRELVATPVRALWTNRRLLRSLASRDIRARYRGSVGEGLWAVLNPLLLMSTYVFVFGFVLKARFPGDSSSAGYLLNFLAGLVPWLGVNEALARAPFSMLENRNIVKKVVFPLEILPAIPILTGFVTQVTALALLFFGYVAVKGLPPASAFWLGPLLVLQAVMMMGVAWLFAAIGVFLRDLGQIIAFLLSLIFFLSPICYPESALPAGARAFLQYSPVYYLVSSYRRVLIDGTGPEFAKTLLMSGLALGVFFAGAALFRRLRGAFPDAL